MRSRRSLWLSVSFLLSWLIVFSGVSIKASADEVRITKVSALSGRAFFGDTIPARVVQAGSPTSFDFTYYDSYTMPAVGLNVASDSIISSPSQMETYDLLIYKATGFAVNVTLDYILLDDFYLRFGDYARGGFALSNWINSSATTAWNDARNFPDNFCGSFPAVRANSDASANLANYYGVMYFQFMSGYNALTFRPIYYDFDNGGVLDSLSFSGVRPYSENGSGVFYLCIICPYIGSSMSGQPPAETTTTDSGAGSVTTVSGGDINVDVNIDLDETNSILEDILQGITDFVADIVEGIVYIFKPVDDDYIENWLDDMGDVISEAFSDKVDIDILRDMLIDLGSYGATTSIEFPSFSIGDYTFPARAVALRPAGFDSLFNLVETAVNLVCTIWVFNMVLMRIKAVFVGESVVEVEGDVE